MDEAVAVLNEALRLEPKAVSDLVRHRVKFQSEELADHPTIQVGVLPDGFDLGLVGLLNGIFGTEHDRIAIEVDDDFYTDPEALIQSFSAYHDWQDKQDEADRLRAADDGGPA